MHTRSLFISLTFFWSFSFQKEKDEEKSKTVPKNRRRYLSKRIACPNAARLCVRGATARRFWGRL